MQNLVGDSSDDGRSDDGEGGKPPVRGIFVVDDVSPPAPTAEAAELSDITKRIIADTGTAYNLVSDPTANKADESIVGVPPVGFSPQTIGSWPSVRFTPTFRGWGIASTICTS